jgi:hypothetical protein
MMLKKILFVFLSICLSSNSFSQGKKLSPKAAISIITAGPGKVLYEGFGHTAIRIKDQDSDIIYNYGFFDFDAPNFYVNFTKGRLLYKLQSYPFHYFVRSNQRDQRWIKEQILNLNQQEKQQIFEYLENNAKPENATYLYDPFFNNCATKPREILESILNNSIQFDDSYITNHQSFRQLMNDEIPWNSWGSFGINLALGSKLDNTATTKQYMYLPDYVYSGFNKAFIIHNDIKENLITKERYILKFDELKQDTSLFSPFYVFMIVLIFGLFITLKDVKNNHRSKWFDFLLFFTTGLIGSFIVFLWFFTNHSTTPTNFNFLWAFAPNLFVAFLIVKKQPKAWLRRYTQLVFILVLIIPIIWLNKVQQLPIASIPLLLLLITRYYFLSTKLLTSH